MENIGGFTGKSGRSPPGRAGEGRALEITVNGQPREVEPDLTVAGLIGQMGIQPKYVAVERNRELVPRATHAECILEPGDELEVVTLVGGG